MATPSDPLLATELEIVKARTSYAWNVWEFHGRQRLSMFNYFLVIVGILINGYLAALKDPSLHRILQAVCFLGFVQCLVFGMIDWRNRKMLYFADECLKKSEGILFQSPPEPHIGPMAMRDREEEGPGLFRYSKMVIWIWMTYILIGAGFLIALIHSTCLLSYGR